MESSAHFEKISGIVVLVLLTLLILRAAQGPGPLRRGRVGSPRERGRQAKCLRYLCSSGRRGGRSPSYVAIRYVG